MKSVYLKIVLFAMSCSLFCSAYAQDTWNRKIENRTQLPIFLYFNVDGGCSNNYSNAVYFGDTPSESVNGYVDGNDANLVLNRQYPILNMRYVRYCGNIMGQMRMPYVSDYDWRTYNAYLTGSWFDTYLNEGTATAPHITKYRFVNNAQVAGTDGDGGNIRICYPDGDILPDFKTVIPANCSDESKLPSDNMICKVGNDSYTFKHANGASIVTSNFGDTSNFQLDINGYVVWAQGEDVQNNSWEFVRGIDNTTWTIQSSTVKAENVVCTQQQ